MGDEHGFQWGSRRQIPEDSPFFFEGNLGRLTNLCQEKSEELVTSSSSGSFAKPMNIVCKWSRCKSTFRTLEKYEQHLLLDHKFACTACHRSFSNIRLLDMHLNEAHSPLFAAQIDRGMSCYKCCVAGCNILLSSNTARNTHLQQFHLYPTIYDFNTEVPLFADEKAVQPVACATCSECGVFKTKAMYSITQWRRGKMQPKTCLDCVAMRTRPSDTPAAAKVVEVVTAPSGASESSSQLLTRRERRALQFGHSHTSPAALSAAGHPPSPLAAPMDVEPDIDFLSASVQRLHVTVPQTIHFGRRGKRK